MNRNDLTLPLIVLFAFAIFFTLLCFLDLDNRIAVVKTDSGCIIVNNGKVINRSDVDIVFKIEGLFFNISGEVTRDGSLTFNKIESCSTYCKLYILDSNGELIGYRRFWIDEFCVRY